MLEPVLRVLAPRPGARIVDATVGLGGHAEAILEHLGAEGELIGVDRDAELLAQAERRLARFGRAARLVHARFSHLREVLGGTGHGQVDGILLDLGICSAQLDDPKRGLSFREGYAEGPLDMRLDRSRGETAAELLERLDEAELARVLRAGDVPAPRRMARAIRARLPIRTAQALVAAVGELRAPRRRHHPATLVFQALRMAVNEELCELESALDASLDLLAPGGRLAILSYHSGEDRRVKARLAAEIRGCICPPDLPRCGCGRAPRLKGVARAERPSEDEIRANPRARSARLRGAERL
jgi:16S rRNA (cytosine1402-N4)-methyltransferase